MEEATVTTVTVWWGEWYFILAWVAAFAASLIIGLATVAISNSLLGFPRRDQGALITIMVLLGGASLAILLAFLVLCSLVKLATNPSAIGRKVGNMLNLSYMGATKWERDGLPTVIAAEVNLASEEVTLKSVEKDYKSLLTSAKVAIKETQVRLQNSLEWEKRLVRLKSVISAKTALTGAASKEAVSAKNYKNEVDNLKLKS